MAYNLIIETQMTGVIMATKIVMKNESGKLKEGFVGWSWTVFFFGCIPPLFRGDFGGFFAILAVTILAEIGTTILLDPGLSTLALLIVRIAWAANYNGWHMQRLKDSGFVIVGDK